MKFVIEDKNRLKETSNKFSELPDSVKSYVSETFVDRLNYLLSDLEECESPIEQLLFTSLYNRIDSAISFITRTVVIVPQKVIQIEGKRYRADIGISVQDLQGRSHHFVIECDGHEFHEKTKEQVMRDRKRERDMMSEGYVVIRFTGSEIVKNPDHCTTQIINIIVATI